MDHASDIIAKAIDRSTSRDRVRRVLVEPSADSEGRDALSVTLILENDELSGSDAVTIISDIQEALLIAADDRFPIIEFATEDEMELDGGPEP